MPEIEAEFSDFKFLLVDRDENIDFCQEMFVMGIPSFIVYVDGKEKIDSSTRIARQKKRSKHF